MSNFKKAFKDMIVNEGGYKLHTVAHDLGGQTYAGISRRYHPGWSGWRDIDNLSPGMPPGLNLLHQVETFYRAEFWEKIKGDEIRPELAGMIFDFAVMVGVKRAVRLAQEVINTDADGIVGPNTLRKLDSVHVETFITRFTLSRIQYHVDRCYKKSSQRKFLLGWIDRALRVDK